MLMMREWQGEQAAIAERALAHAAEYERKIGPVKAEPTPEPARWYMIRVTPGRELSAASHLSGRRFGVYVPLEQRRNGKDDRPLLPGYLFVFVWNIDRQWRRIRICPDVVALMDVTVPDAMIAELQKIEFRKMIADSMPLRRKIMGRRRRRRAADAGGEIEYLVTPWSALHRELDPEKRLSALHRALSLEL